MSVRHALLALLSDGPRYGLQLRQDFEARTGEVWPLNVGQVYQSLQRLERDGLVASDDVGDAGPQKRFRITGPGSEELMAWLHTPATSAAPPRDELVMKVLVGMSVPGVVVVEVLQAHRRHLVEEMQRYTAVKADDPDQDVVLALVVDAQIFRLDAAIRWLDAADTRLSRRRPGAPAAASARRRNEDAPGERETEAQHEVRP